MMSWKLARDPYLGPLVAKHGDAYATSAGFFFDEDPADAALDDVDWLCTPLPRAPTAQVKRPVVLLSTGGFCPVHPGHLAMMERARAAAVTAGFDVLAGYLSPGHDSYVELKCGPAAIPASERLRLCAMAAAESGWLLVDPWEAQHRRVSVNYTDVTARLRAYLREHVHPELDVLYVCGGDNARFALAFVEDGGCIVVGRPGAEAENASWHAKLADEGRITWCDGDHPAASRAIRAPSWIDETKRRVVVRLEDARAVRTLGLAPERFSSFQRELVALFAEVLGEGAVRTRDLDTEAGEDDVISLDAMLPARQNLAVTRLFALGGYQALGHVARPGAPPLEAQLAALPPGDYALRDDDRMTGGTLEAVRAMLPPAIRIHGTRLAVDHDAGEDVADSRDFLLGTDDGGLVVALSHDRSGRVPYAFPYVDPAVRCSVPPRLAHAFSRRVWALGERTFRGTGLRLRDAPLPARVAMAAFGEDRLLEEVCRWHAARIVERRATTSAE